LRRVTEVQRDGTVDEGIEPLFDWLRGFQEFTARLLDILDLPVGPERFSSLQAWKLALDARQGDFLKAREEMRKRAKRAHETVVGKIFARTEGLLEALLDVWRSDCNEHLNSARLSATLSPALVTLGISTEISVALVNEGALPLRKLSFETQPYDSKAECSL